MTEGSSLKSPVPFVHDLPRFRTRVHTCQFADTNPQRERGMEFRSSLTLLVSVKFAILSHLRKITVYRIAGPSTSACETRAGSEILGGASSATSIVPLNQAPEFAAGIEPRPAGSRS